MSFFLGVILFVAVWVRFGAIVLALDVAVA